MDMAFHQRLRDGFLTIAAEEPHRCAVVPADQTEDEVARAILAVIDVRLA
jgi:dTMP kinase